jgi:hypothetical protein
MTTTTATAHAEQDESVRELTADETDEIAGGFVIIALAGSAQQNDTVAQTVAPTFDIAGWAPGAPHPRG